MKKILLLLLLIPCSVFALADNAKSSILIDFNTGKVLHENRADERMPMASMTKMMTMLILMEAVDSGQIKLNDDIVISHNASSMGGSQAYLEENTKMKLDVLLKAVAIASANDAAVAIAEAIAGSTDEFVKLMNKRAKELKLTNTNFVNVHGLDHSDHYSSARDMANLARELVKHDKILLFSSIYEDYIEHPNGQSTWIVNTNKIVYKFL